MACATSALGGGGLPPVPDGGMLGPGGSTKKIGGPPMTRVGTEVAGVPVGVAACVGVFVEITVAVSVGVKLGVAVGVSVCVLVGAGV